MGVTVVTIKPNEDVKVEKEFDLTYEGLTGFINGYLEAVTLVRNSERHVVMYLHEEGKLIGLPPTIALANSEGKVFDVVLGNVLFCAVDDEGCETGLSDDEVRMIQSFIRPCTPSPNSPYLIDKALIMP